MFKVDVAEIDETLGIVLPNEVLQQLNVRVGDFLYLTESPDGFHISPSDPQFEGEMRLARKAMRERRNLLRELPKS
jgi:putative addiction module antidote